MIRHITINQHPLLTRKYDTRISNSALKKILNQLKMS